MATPDYLDIRTLCLRSLRRAGQPLPSADMVNECVNIQLQEVKSDIQFWASDHPLLLSRTVSATTKGVRKYTQPASMNRMKQILLLDGPDAWRGTMSSTTALATSMDEDEDSLIGKIWLLTGGTGSGQWRFITAWNNTTKVPTPDTAFSTTPDTTTTYLIVNEQTPIYNSEKNAQLDPIADATRLDKPCRATVHGEEIWTDYAPDKIYGLWYEYYVDVSKLDEEGTLFKQMVREWLSVFMQGLIAKNMQLYDDERANDNMIMYREFLRQLQVDSLEVGQTIPHG